MVTLSFVSRLKSKSKNKNNTIMTFNKSKLEWNKIHLVKGMYL